MYYNNPRHWEGRWLNTQFSKRGGRAAGLPSAALTLLIGQPLTITQLANKISKVIYKNKVSKDRILKVLYRLVDKLEEEGLIIKRKVGKYAFLHITPKGLIWLAKVDLNPFLAASKPGWDWTFSQKELDIYKEELYTKKIGIVSVPASKYWREVSLLNLKEPLELTDLDKELLNFSFVEYLSDYGSKLLIFADLEEERLIVKEYNSRFVNLKVARKQIIKFREAFELATQKYDKGVYLTITIPPCIPIKYGIYALKYMLHRLKAYIRRKYGSYPHVAVIEPQDSLNPHIHAVIFGIPRIMDKRELTRWLEDKLIRFLAKLGDNLVYTFRKQLTEEQVKYLNKLGKKLLKKYLRYKKKLRKESEGKYEGPINWITKIEFNKDEGRWEFENEPPDYKGKDVLYYLMKYLLKNLYTAERVAKMVKEGKTPQDIFEELGDEELTKLAWYWLTRTRFYTLSPSLRRKDKKRRSQGGDRYRYVCCITEERLAEILELEEAYMDVEDKEEEVKELLSDEI